MKESGIKKNHKKEKMSKDLLPLMILFGGLPLVTGIKAVNMPLTEYAWFPAGAEQYDFFLYWKGVLFLALAVWMLVVLTDRIIIRGQRDFCWKSFLPLGIYGVLAVISTIVSSEKKLSLQGMWEQHETVWVLLGYVVTVFYGCHVVETERDEKWLCAAFGVGAALQGVLGILQMAGKDFFSSEIGKKLVFLGANQKLEESLQFGFAQSQREKVYLASYNPNNAAVYLLLVLPLFLIAAGKAKSRKARIGNAALAAVLLVCLWGTGSKMGFFAAMAMVILGGFLLLEKKKGRRLFVVLSLAAAILLTAAYEFLGGHELSESISRSLRKVESYKMEDIIPLEKSVEIHYDGKIAELTVEEVEGEGVLSAKNERGTNLGIRKKKKKWVIDESGFEGISFGVWKQEGGDTLMIYYNGSQLAYVKPEGGSYTYVNSYGQADEIVRAESLLFDGYEKALSGRGYIWGRCLPLLLHYPLWGAGPDTFTVIFPQDDYLMRANTGARIYRQIISRPHSLFFQTAIQTGLLSLGALLVFWGIYMKGYLGSQKAGKGKDGFETGIFLGICGYLFMGALNDSCLAAAPIFWGMLGLGMSIIRRRSNVTIFK